MITYSPLVPLSKITRYILSNLSKSLSTSSSYLLTPSLIPSPFDTNLIIDADHGQDFNLIVSTLPPSVSPSVTSFNSLSPEPLIGHRAEVDDQEQNQISGKKSLARSIFDFSDESIKLDWLISDWSTCSQSCHYHGIQVKYKLLQLN